MKKKFVILTISSLALLIILNNYAKAQLTKEQLEAFRSVKTIKIVVQQSYGEAKGISMPFEEFAKKLLYYAEVTVIEEDDKDYEATLKIQAVGTALRDKYIGVGYQYSGAIIEGNILYDFPGLPAYKKRFEGNTGCPFTISGIYAIPSSAPFYQAFEIGFIPGMLELIKDIYDINCIIAVLQDNSAKVRKTAVNILGKIGGERVVEPLIFALKDNDRNVRRTAVKALGKIKDSRVVEALNTALQDEDSSVRGWVIEYLGKIKDTRSIEPLVYIMKNGERLNRMTAAKVLDKLRWRPKNNEERIFYLIAKEKWDKCVRMGNLAVEPLITAMSAKDPRIRGNVIITLSKINDPHAVKAVIKALKDEDPQIRGVAVVSLMLKKDPFSVDPLIALLNDKDKNVRMATAVALKNITGKDFGEDYEKWQKWWEANKDKFLKKK